MAIMIECPGMVIKCPGMVIKCPGSGVKKEKPKNAAVNGTFSEVKPAANVDAV